MKSLKSFSIAVSLCIPVGSIALAEGTPRVTAAPLANAFYAEYSVLEDVQACNGKDQVAFRVTAQLDDMSFRSFEIDKTAYADFKMVDPDVFENPDTIEMCERIMRRGTERSVVAFPCEEQIDNSTAEPIDINPPVSLSVTVSIDSCLSPVDLNVIGGNWSAKFQQENSETTVEGEIFDTTAPLESLNYAGGPFAFPAHRRRGNVFSRTWLQNQNDQAMITALKFVPRIDLRLNCLPLVLSERSDSPLYVTTSALLFLHSGDAPQTCAGTACAVLNDQDRMPNLAGMCETE